VKHLLGRACYCSSSAWCCLLLCLPLQQSLCAVLLQQVDDPSKYGVLIINEYGQVQQFVEKPKVCLRCCGKRHAMHFLAAGAPFTSAPATLSWIILGAKNLQNDCKHCTSGLKHWMLLTVNCLDDAGVRG